VRQRPAELAAAFGLLTRLPAWRWVEGADAVDPAKAVWAYPVVGAVAGCLGGGAFWLAWAAGIPAAPAAFWSLAALVLLTGALHEDGLADTADGFGGGDNRQRKLDIMRDSRIGSFGAIALLLSLALRGSAIASMAGPRDVAVALVVSGMLGRGGMLVVLLAARPARPDGLAAALRGVSAGTAAFGIAIAVVAAWALLGAASWGVLAATLVCSLGLAWLARAQVGGYTGDVLGATEVVGECVVLTLLSL
jgi:adenosylcobinamide-GDP ribazoletransferase